MKKTCMIIIPEDNRYAEKVYAAKADLKTRAK